MEWIFLSFFAGFMIGGTLVARFLGRDYPKGDGSPIPPKSRRPVKINIIERKKGVPTRGTTDG